MLHMVIHDLPVGGGTLALSPLPGRSGDYDGDLALIAEWKPGLVISMTTELEMFGAGALQFGPDIQSRASRWAHLPVTDFSAPPIAIQEAWPEVSADARHALNGGGRVLVHCRGGCGRSGMVALRLMIEGGEAPEAALTRLRAVRPCAVETEDQMEWAMAARARTCPDQRRVL
ncbi:protein phosphatase [Ruegeria sp. 2012CJ41-6]|uniref:protein-tyrosine-phosphatase n=1 Tax=Ruegeria spongiae TaxID=2942209 RepID=A0ABT0PXK4_9RHOB|nr:protein-tyrosine phosphatase family protein [Ruegeria spongiae]MCL6282320.1 protein phosphatase [Ruegeria spongiae]